MEQEEQFEVRDLRDKGRFVIDDKFLNGYARFVGIYAVGVYNSLCRHADKKQKCWPSIDKISKELDVGRNSVIEAIKRLVYWRIIIKRRVGKQATNRYLLPKKTYWKPISEVYLKDYSEVCDINFRGLQGKLQEFTTQTSNSKETHSKETQEKGNTTIAAKPQDNTNNPLSLIVNYFYEVNKWPLPKTAPEQKLYRRWLRSAKELLELCEGDVEEAQNCIKKVGEWAVSRELSWGIETVFKQWYNLDFLKPKEKKPYFEGKRIFQKIPNGKWWCISRDGEIRELDLWPKPEQIVYK